MDKDIQKEINLHLENTIMKKIWFVNYVLVSMWVIIVFIDVAPFITITNQFLSTTLYALAGIIPAFLIAEGIGLWKHYKINVKNPYEKDNKKEGN